jgi:hypothetical protein
MNSVMQSQETKDIQPFTSIAKEFCIYDKTDEEIEEALRDGLDSGLVFLGQDSLSGDIWVRYYDKAKDKVLSDGSIWEGASDTNIFISWEDFYHKKKFYYSIKDARRERRNLSYAFGKHGLLEYIKKGRDRFMSGEKCDEIFRGRACKLIYFCPTNKRIMIIKECIKEGCTILKEWVELPM